MKAQFTYIGGIKGTRNINSLHCIGEKIYAVSGNIIYMSENDGSSWNFLSVIEGKNISEIKGKGDHLVYLSSDEDIIFEEFYFHISVDGGKTWVKKKHTFVDFFYAFIDDVSLIVEDQFIVIAANDFLFLSRDKGDSFNIRDFDGLDYHNDVYFLNDHFYFIEQRKITVSSDLITFKNLPLNSSNTIIYHFRSKNYLYIYDGQLKVLKDSIFDPLNIEIEDIMFSDISYIDNKIYLYGFDRVYLYDEEKNDLFDLELYLNVLKINNGIMYFQYIDSTEGLLKKSLEISNAPVISISNFDIIRDANIYNAQDVIWHDKYQLAYFDINANRWRATPFNKTKNELYGVANKNEIFVKKPQTAIMNLNGLKIRNSNIDSKINTLINCGDILIGKDEDKKFYGLHRGILPWIEISIPSSWVNVTAGLSNGLYIIHDGRRDMIISEDGYLWRSISTHSIGLIIDVKKTENGKLMCATQNKIFSLNEITQDWELVPTETLPFVRDNISGFETYKNTLIVSQINGGIAYSLNFGIDWYKWDDGLPNFGFKNAILSGENYFVNFNGELYKRSIKDIPDLSALDEVDGYKNSMKLFPVPVKDKLNLLIGNKSDAQNCLIINKDGRYLRNTSLNNENQLDVSDLADGVYFLSVDTPKGKTIGKFIKIR